MLLRFIICVGGVLAIAVPPDSLQTDFREIATNTQPVLPSNVVYSEKSPVKSVTNHLRHKKKQLRHRGRKHRRQNSNRLSSARRYFEKQMLVRNRTLMLLGIGMEKFLPNAVDLLDINPQELPGESPFQNWHSQKPNHTVKAKEVLVQFHSSETGPTRSLETYPQQTVVSRGNNRETGYQYDYETFSQQEDTGQLQRNFGTALNRLLSIFANYSSKNDVERTPCQQWMDCRDQLKDAFMGLLPACPCEYPSSIFYEDKVWDSAQDKYFRWRDVSGERLDVYKPGAEYCIRSLLVQGTLTLAVQHCCYDRERQLLTRGSGAGTPNLVSPDVSPQLHDRVDVLPWRLCKGDFTVYNRVRPPNNANNCTDNPDNTEFNRQVQLTKYY